MKVDSSIQIEVAEGVYNPAEDSYLLIKAIEVNGGEKALDMGCGCGIVAMHLAKNGCSVTACDVNQKAVENSMINAERNGLKIKCVKSNLFENINDKFDLIVFNPPYLPTENEDISWDGGEEGIEVIEEFLKDAKNYLNEGGKIYLVSSSISNFKKLIEKFKHMYRFKEVVEERYFFEKISVYEITVL